MGLRGQHGCGGWRCFRAAACFGGLGGFGGTAAFGKRMGSCLCSRFDRWFRQYFCHWFGKFGRGLGRLWRWFGGCFLAGRRSRLCPGHSLDNRLGFYCGHSGFGRLGYFLHSLDRGFSRDLACCWQDFHGWFDGGRSGLCLDRCLGLALFRLGFHGVSPGGIRLRVAFWRPLRFSGQTAVGQPGPVCCQISWFFCRLPVFSGHFTAALDLYFV